MLRQLVDYPDDIMITHEEGPKKVAYRLQVRKSDIPKVIGKHGQTIAALRNLLIRFRENSRSVVEEGPFSA